MKNRILNFDDFKKGTPVQEPKKHALIAGGEDTPKKEKAIDQVKRASLAGMTVTEPDYSKTQKVDEAEITSAATLLKSQVDAKQAEIDALKKANPVDNTMVSQKEKEKADLMKQLEDRNTADAVAAKQQPK